MDLSKRGARLRVDWPVLTGECLDLNIHFSDSLQPVRIGRAVARWSKGRECGVEFTDPSPELDSRIALCGQGARLDGLDQAARTQPEPLDVSPGPVRTREAVKAVQGRAVVLHVVAAVVLLSAAAAIQAYENRSARILGERLGAVAEEVAGQLDRVLAERYREMREAAQSLVGQNYDRQAVARQVMRLKESDPLYLWVGGLDRTGRVVAASDPALIERDPSRSTGLRLAQEFRSGHVSHSDIHQESRGAEAVAFTVPIVSPNGEVLGALTSRVSVAALHDVVVKPTVRRRQAALTSSGMPTYQIVNQQGVAFIDSDPVRGGNAPVTDLGAVSARLSRAGISGYVKEVDRRRRIPIVTGYARMQGLEDFPGLRWGVFVRQDQSRILASLRERIRSWTGGGREELSESTR